MDVVSDQKITRLMATRGKIRVYEMEDGTWLTARDGSVAWRNNNPGNLKIEYEGSADKTVNSTRSKEAALEQANKLYAGVIDLDQWGNIVFESYDAGRQAQRELVERRHAERTVEQLLEKYSFADYSGATNHANQAKVVHATADALGHDLRGKLVKNMTHDEKNALLDGIARAERWTAGQTQVSPPLSNEELQAALNRPSVAAKAPVYRQGNHGEAVKQLQEDLIALGMTAKDGSAIRADGHFGPRTKEAVAAFQKAYQLDEDGVAGRRTLAKIDSAKSLASAAPVELTDARHPAHDLYTQAFACIARIDESQGRQPGAHTQRFAGGLTAAAVAAGLQRIDHVVLSDDASRGFAVEGALDCPFKRYAGVDVMQAIRTPMAQSSQEAAAQQQTTSEQMMSMREIESVQQHGPSMAR